MPSATSRLAAVVALTALLACSGLGLCWRQVASDAHGCCTGDEAMSAPAKACAGAVANVTPVKLPPPQADAAPAVSRTVLLAVLPPSPAAFAPSFPVKSPPLVLRI